MIHLINYSEKTYFLEKTHVGGISSLLRGAINDGRTGGISKSPLNINRKSVIWAIIATDFSVKYEAYILIIQP